VAEASVPPAQRMFAAFTYFWVLPAAERKQAYAAAGVSPDEAPIGRSRDRRALLVLRPPSGATLSGNAMPHPLGITRLSTGFDGRPIFVVGRFTAR
jgi:hypothetical protein